MGTFRSNTGLALTLVSLACSTSPSATESARAAAEVAPMTRNTIEHVVPKRDFVGAAPVRFEWTPADGVDEYALTVENDVDMQIFEGRSRDTSLEWPKGNRLDSGTYFWRVVGVKDGRRIADSGRAAFVVVEQ